MKGSFDVASNGSQSSESTRSVRDRVIRVYVIDDHPVICRMFEVRLEREPDLVLVGSSTTTPLGLLPRLEEGVDVLVLDISLGDGEGLDFLSDLRALSSPPNVLVFSMYPEDFYAERVLDCGALGYLMKSESTDRVIQGVRQVARGEVVLSDGLTSRIIRQTLLSVNDGPAFAFSSLTDRERSICEMVGDGASIGEIAANLGLSTKTVETYRRRAKEKLGLRSTSELQQFAIEWQYQRGSSSDSDDR